MSNCKELSILSIGYGRHFFDTNNSERKRMEACAKMVGEYHMIIFTHASDGCVATVSPQGLHLHPTNSINKFMMVVDAIRLGLSILTPSASQWVLTAQDPFEAGLVGYVLARRRAVPLNVQEHGDFFSTPHWRRDTLLNRPRYYFGKWLLCHADSVRVVSERIARTLRQRGVAAKKISILSVWSSLVVRDTSIAPFDYQFPADAIVVMTMARLVRQKNLPLLIRAFAAVYATTPQARLVIIGDGPEATSLQALVQKLKISEAVHFLPWTADPAAHYAAADVFALSSDWEGWARTLVEAMHYGVPIITTDVGCAGEVIKNNEHGFVVPVRDGKCYQEKLQQLVSDEALRTQFSDHNQASAERPVHTSFTDYAVAWAKVFSVSGQ